MYNGGQEVLIFSVVVCSRFNVGNIDSCVIDKTPSFRSFIQCIFVRMATCRLSVSS